MSGVIRPRNSTGLFKDIRDDDYISNVTKNCYLYNESATPKWTLVDSVGTDFALTPTGSTVELSKSFNILHAESFVVTFSPVSFKETYNLHIELLIIVLNDLIKLLPNTDRVLGIMEFSQIRGYHFHIIIFNHVKADKTTISSYLATFNKIIECQKKEKDEEVQVPVLPVVTHQTVKSVGSYINYVKKNPLALIGNNVQVIRMFLGFDREHIFKKDSVPKRKRDTSTLKIQSNNELVLFYYQMFENNILTYQDILRSPSIQAYLHLPNIKQVFDNCKMQFLAQADHEYNLIKIIENGNNHKCWCPLREWLYFHDIEIDTFAVALEHWILMADKKNTLLFKGVADSGKSHIARLLWKLFINNQRIVQDSIFTFANLINAGCGLWEEPFITPESVDTAKLILEGCPDVQIAIKGQSSVKLNKRVPIIITSNHELHRYVSGDKDALAARCFIFDRFYNKYPSDFCNATNHYCIHILSDCANSECETSGRYTGEINKRRRTTRPSEEEENCNGRHPVKIEHIQAFVSYLMRRQPLSSFSKFSNTLRDTVRSTNYESSCDLSKREELWLEVYEELISHSL
ncbi:putative NS1 [Haiju virus]|nr:putative NS1 [Haiju virus]